jgi:predicted aldo/keto reductase-like oxidoreductase
MKSVRLGKTELLVSEVGFGGIPIIPLRLEAAVSVVRHCFEQGITFFDTANMYGDSESKIGHALAPVRDRTILATKTLKRDAEGASKHLAHSLQNLKTDRIDLYQLHNISTEAELKEVLSPGGAFDAANLARKDGRVNFIGFTSHDIATSIEACRSGYFSTVQIPFNFIEHDPADELFKVAEELDIGVIAMKPLGGGLLDRADLCFRFLQQYPHVVPIPGASSQEEVDEIIDYYRSPRLLSEDDHKQIEKIRSELGKVFCHRCGYCIPCEQEVDIPGVMIFRSMVARRLPPSRVIKMVKPAMESAENCIECGECSEKCPYGLPIPELLKENLSLFEAYQNTSNVVSI